MSIPVIPETRPEDRDCDPAALSLKFLYVLPYTGQYQEEGDADRIPQNREPTLARFFLLQSHRLHPIPHTDAVSP